MINSSSYRIYRMQIRTQAASGLTDNNEQQPGSLLARQIVPKYLLHLPVWLFLYFLPDLLLFAVNEQPHFSLANPLNAVYLLSFILVLLFSYLNYYWLVEWFFAKKKYAGYFALCTVLIAGITSLQYLAEDAMAAFENASLQPGFLSRLNYNFILLILSMFSAVVLWLQQAVAAGKNELSQAKISYLNTQINPHFLFNSLNWIYCLAIERSAQTSKAVIQLSGLMRYVLKESNSNSIELKKELEYINNYLSLQKGRLGNTVMLNYSIPSYNGNGRIAPLLAMSFIENAFKHGINPNEDCSIKISFVIANGIVCLQVVNKKVAATDSVASKGVGIKNAQQRLALLYPNAHNLEIMEDEKTYYVKLSINIL